MKRFYIFLVACLSFFGCQQRIDSLAGGNGGKLSVDLYNEIMQVPTTRVNDAGFCDADKVGIYVVNYKGSTPGKLLVKGNQADNVKFTLNELTGAWVPEVPVYYLDAKTKVDLYGYYPYSAPASIEQYGHSVELDQSTDAADGKLGGYEASDFLWGKASDVTPSSQRVNISFEHRMAGVMVTLAQGTGFADGEFAGLEKAVLVTNTSRKANIDLSGGTVSVIDGAEARGIVPFHSNGSYRAIVVPQSMGASASLFTITVDGTVYTFVKSESFEYLSGKLHKFTVEVSKKGQSGLEFKLLGQSITAWESDNMSHDGTAREYIVVDCPSGGQLSASISALDKNATRIKNLKVTGKIDADDFFFMRDSMSALQSVNLKEVSVVEKKSDYGYLRAAANEIPYEAFDNKKTLVRFVFPDNITSIGSSAFRGTNLSGSLIIPNGVTEIAFEAFNQCVGLNGTLTLPNSLKKIGWFAFNQCKFIGNLIIPESVTEIDGSAFQYCSSFTGQLILPDGLQHLGERAFLSCSGFTGSLKIPKQIKEIPGYAFSSCSGLNGQLILHSNITSIGSYAFYDCQFRGPLELPEGLVVVGESVFYGNNFSGKLVLPSTLTVLGAGAFSSNYRLTGVVELPEELNAIAANLFAYCSGLEGVIMPRNIESIGAGAFENCFQLNSISCRAQSPPFINATAFNGVAKDNFTVEVPENAVATYITTPVWNEFKRFSAYREFSISRNLYRALNAQSSTKMVVRALNNAQWSVENKPDWVTVTPSSGTGKVEVVITVNNQAKGAGNRDGEVAFLLNDKDYRAKLKIAQYDYTHGDGDVITNQQATNGSGVNLVFMADCFDAKDIAEGKYIDGVNTAIEHFFAVEPYKTYRNYFNVYTVLGMSPDSGVGSVNTIRESKFGSAYMSNGIKPDENITFNYACKAPINDDVSNTLVTLVLNTSEYDGVCYMWGDGSAIACCPMSADDYPYDFRGIVQHEAGGHGFGKLGDEYIYHNAFIQSCNCPCCNHVDAFNQSKALGWFDNLSLTGSMHSVPWAHLIFDPQYSNLVDIYEGGYMHMRGVFRSEPNSCMNNNIPYFSAVSRESIVKRLKKYAGQTYSFTEFKLLDVAMPTQPTASKALQFMPPMISNQRNAPVYMGDKPNFKKN